MKKMKLLATVMAAVLVALDHIIKAWTLRVLAPVRTIPVIQGLFSLTYVENRGAAFGIFQGNTRILSIVTGVVMAAALLYVYFGKLKDKSLVWIIMLIVSGGLGNLIDRVFRGFVVDYLDFSALFGFPVFNLADCCVVVGTGLLLIYVIRLEHKEKKQANGERGSL